MNEFIRTVLGRPEIKKLPKPRQAVVRVLMGECGMSAFMANRHWNEFKIMCLSQ